MITVAACRLGVMMLSVASLGALTASHYKPLGEPGLTYHGVVADVQSIGSARVILDQANPNRLFLILVSELGFGLDFNQSAVRAKFVSDMLSQQCGTPKIVQTRVTETDVPSKRWIRQYTLEIECPYAASRVVAE